MKGLLKNDVMPIKDFRSKMNDGDSRKQCKIYLECHKKTGQDKAFSIEDTVICGSCMYAGHKPFKIYPIGVVKNKLKGAQQGFGTFGYLGPVFILNNLKELLKR